MSWFAIDRGATPIYRQIRDRIRALILGGSLPAGTQLPSSRALADTLKVSRGSIVTAYEALQSEGMLEPLGRKGTYVGRETPLRTSEAVNTKTTEALPTDRHRRSADVPRLQVVADLSTLAPVFDRLSAERLRLCLNRVLAAAAPAVLGDGSYEGYEPFRAWIASYMTERGVSSSGDNVLTVSCYREGLALVCKALLASSDTVVVENPTSVKNISLLRSTGATVRGVPVTSTGVDVDEIDKLAKKSSVKLVCVRPLFHDPTGVTMTQDARHALLECAERHGFAVVEDAFGDELCYSGRLIPFLKAEENSERVVYIDSLSRTLFPDTRTGWIVASRSYVKTFSSAKRVMDLKSSIVLESACYEFCRMGFLRNHVLRVRREYQRRRQALLEALDRYMPRTVTWRVSEGGLTAWLTLPRRVDSQVIYEEARKAGVLVAPGTMFFVDGGGHRNLRLAYGSADEAELDTGVRILSQVLRNAARRPPS